MNKQRFTLVLLLIPFVFALYAADAPSEYYQERADLLISQVADGYNPPNIGIGDSEKYYWPKAMARFQKYGVNDSIANSYIKKRGPQSAFHFTVVGMTRLLYQFSDAPEMQANFEAIMEKNLKASLTTTEGTENHLNMERTSIFLISQLALEKGILSGIAQEQYDDSKEWILTWSKRVYQQGIGEWNSSIYATYSLLGWLNLYDFSKDPQVKAAAKAVVDYYAAEIALHYSWGALGGTEMRGNAETDKNYTSTAYLGWLWFGTTTEFPQGFSKNDYIQSVHAVLSTYRPSKQIVELGQKKEGERVWFQNSKASYLYEEQSFCKQDFYMSENFTLGNLVCGYGGYTGASNQIVPWRLVVRTDNYMPHEIGGGGRYRNSWNGQGREPFTQTVQYENTLILLSKLPEDLEAHNTRVTEIVEQWKIDWAHDYAIRQGEKSNVVNQTDGSQCDDISYINIPSTFDPIVEGKKVYVDAGKVYLVLSFLHTPVVETTGSRKVIKDIGENGELTGYALEVVEKSDVTSFEKLKSSTKDVNLVQKDDCTVTYVNQSKNQLEAVFNGYGTCMEPLFDWGYGALEKMCLLAAPPFRQPDWGTADGFGKIPTFKVDGSEVDYVSVRPVYEGRLLSVKDGVMLVKTTDKHYKVDYTEDTPVCSEVDPASFVESHEQSLPTVFYNSQSWNLSVSVADDSKHDIRVMTLTGSILYSNSFVRNIDIPVNVIEQGVYMVCVDEKATKICIF